jgi:hypothetical protein
MNNLAEELLRIRQFQKPIAEPCVSDPTTVYIRSQLQATQTADTHSLLFDAQLRLWRNPIIDIPGIRVYNPPEHRSHDILVLFDLFQISLPRYPHRRLRSGIYGLCNSLELFLFLLLNPSFERLLPLPFPCWNLAGKKCRCTCTGCRRTRQRLCRTRLFGWRLIL